MEREKRNHLLLLDQRPGISSAPRTGGTPDTVDVLAHVHRRVVTDDMRDMTDIDTAGDKIRADKTEFGAC